MSRVKKSLDHKRIRRLIWLVLAVFVLLLQSVFGSAYYSLIMQAYGTVGSPPFILEEGTAGTSTIYANSTSAKASVEAPLFDYVDNNDPDVDSTVDKGMHSNFPSQQAGPDSTYDALKEENTEAIEDYVDNNVSDLDGSGDKGTLSDFDNMKTKDGMANLTEVAGGTPADLQVSTTCMDQMWNQGQDYEWYSAWAPPGSGTVTVTKLWFWDGDGTVGTGETIYMAMYEDGGGYSKLSGSDTTLTGTGSQGWLSADVSTSFEITLGTTYWIGATCASGGTYNICRDDGANCGNYPPNGVGTYYQTNSYVLDSSVPTGASQSINKYIIPGITYTTGTGDYELDQEVQFTNVIDFLPTEKLCIYTGPLGDEDLRVDYWNGTGWDNLATDLIAYSCNEYTVSLTSVNYTIRFKGGTESSDTTQDQWQIAACLLRVEGAGSREDAVDQQSNVDGPADVGTHSNFTAQQYGPDSINDTLTEADTSASDNNNVDSEIATEGSTTGISGAQTADGTTENVTEGAIVGDAPVLVSYEVNEGADVTSISVNKPSGTSSGDLLIILLGTDGTTPQPSTPTGFTYITTWYAADGHIQCSWYREADGTEGASFSSDWSGGNAEEAVMACLRITGWDSGDFPHKIATNNAIDGDPVFPAVTTEKDNCLILRWYGMDDDDDSEPIFGVPSGHDEIFARETDGTSGPTTLAACNRTWATAGGTGTATWNQAATTEGWNTVTLAIAPEVVGYQLDVEHVVNSVAQYENYNLTTRAYRSAENFYLQLYNFSSSQWVNMSTIAAASLTWYNTTIAKADFVNSTNQARIRYWQGSGAAQETLYVDYSGVYGWNATNYELDLEGHWTDLPYSLPNEELCIYAGATGTEDIRVDVWNGSSWINIISDMNASAWNNVTITSYLTSSNFTIRFKGGSETGDASLDTWQIDVALIRVWHDGGEDYELDLEVQWASAVYTRTNEELRIRTGTFSGSENIQVRVWNTTGSSWHWVMNLTANQWNNVSITSYLTSNTFTVQFLGGTETGDATEDSWNIDVSLLHVWTAGTTYDYVLRVNNTETDSWQIRLKKYSDSNINRLRSCTIYFHNSTDGTSSQICIQDGSYINQTGPWYDLGDSETIYIAMTVQATSTGTSYVRTYLEILIPNTSTYIQYIITFEIT